MKAIYSQVWAFGSAIDPVEPEKYHQKKQDLKAPWWSLREYEEILSLYFYFWFWLASFLHIKSGQLLKKKKQEDSNLEADQTFQTEM